MSDPGWVGGGGRGGAAGAAPDTQPQEPTQVFWSDSGRQHRTLAGQISPCCLPASGGLFQAGRPPHPPTQVLTLRQLQRIPTDAHLTPDAHRPVGHPHLEATSSRTLSLVGDDSDPPKHGPHSQPTRPALNLPRARASPSVMEALNFTLELALSAE